MAAARANAALLEAFGELAKTMKDSVQQSQDTLTQKLSNTIQSGLEEVKVTVREFKFQMSNFQTKRQTSGLILAFLTARLCVVPSSSSSAPSDGQIEGHHRGVPCPDRNEISGAW